MLQLIVFRRGFADIHVTRTTVTAMVPEQGQRRTVVVLRLITRAGCQVIVSDQLINSSANRR